MWNSDDVYSAIGFSAGIFIGQILVDIFNTTPIDLFSVVIVAVFSFFGYLGFSRYCIRRNNIG